MTFKVIRDDGLTRDFEWGFFRYTDGGASMVSAFLLSKNTAKMYGVTFVDRDTQGKIQVVTQKLSQAWQKYSRYPKEEGGDDADVAKRLEEFRALVRKGTTYSKLNAWTKIGDFNPWKVGKYSLELTQ